MMKMLDTGRKIREAMCKEVAAWMAEVFWDFVGKNAEEFLAEDRIHLF
jgi:hypothetical protein